MTIREGFDRIVELYDIEDVYEESLGQFKQVCQDSPLTNAQEDTFIQQYKSLLEDLEVIHYQVATAFLDWIIAARES